MTLLYIVIALGAILSLAAWLTTSDAPTRVPLIMSVQSTPGRFVDTWEFDPYVHTDNVLDERLASLRADPYVSNIEWSSVLQPDAGGYFYTVTYRRDRA